MVVPVEKLTKAYIKIRDKRSELSANFKEEDGKLAEKQDKIKRALLDYCKEQGVDSVRTPAGLFWRTINATGQATGNLCTLLSWITMSLSFSRSVSIKPMYVSS